MNLFICWVSVVAWCDAHTFHLACTPPPPPPPRHVGSASDALPSLADAPLLVPVAAATAAPHVVAVPTATTDDIEAGGAATIPRAGEAIDVPQISQDASSVFPTDDALEAAYQVRC